MSNAYSRILGALESNGNLIQGNRNSKHVKAQCPAHDDKAPSLSITDRDDKVLMECRAGCSVNSVLHAIGMQVSDMFDNKPPPKARPTTVATYSYTDENNTLVYEVRRIEPGWNGESKTFLPYLPGAQKSGLGNVPRVLYNLPAVIRYSKAGLIVYVVEGEKDADTLISKGFCATTMPGGAGKWLPQYTEALKSGKQGGARVIIIRDNDEPGHTHAWKVNDELVNAGLRVEVLAPIAGKDVTNHFEAGRGIDDFVPISREWDRFKTERNGSSITVSDPNNPERSLRLTRASSIRVRPVRWIWDQRIPKGAVTLTPGMGGIGKSLFHCWIIAKITTGELPGVHLGQPRACMIVATEDSYEMTIAPRLIAAGANLDLVYRIDVTTEQMQGVTLSLPTDVAIFEQAIKQERIALVSLDPLLGTIEGKLDTHKDRDVRTALDPIVKIADRTGCAILGNAHWNKSNATDAANRVMGSAAFNNVVRAALTFVRDDESEDEEPRFVITQTKNNLGRTHDLASLNYSIEQVVIDTDEGEAVTARLVMLGETSRSANDILKSSGTSRNLGENKLRILEYVNSNDGVTTAKDIAMALGMNSKTAANALNDLAKNGHVDSPSRGVYQRLSSSSSRERKERGESRESRERGETNSRLSRLSLSRMDERKSGNGLRQPDVDEIALDFDRITHEFDENE